MIPTDPPTPGTPEPEKPTSASILTEVASRIAASTDDVKEELITRLVDKEIGDRVKLLEAALEKRAQAQVEVRKVEKPETELFDADGKPVMQAFSKEKVKAIKEAREKLQKVETAIEKALAGDFSKLKELK